MLSIILIASISTNISALHKGRHTWASAMRDMGCDLSLISKGLGHESLKTTQIYLSTIDTSAVAKANRKMMDKILK